MVSPRGIFEQWTVLEHGPIQPLADDVWYVEGTLPPPFAGGKRGMTIVRDGEGSLLLHNAVALDDATMNQLESLGEIRTIVVPSRSHRLDCGIFKQRYPNARLLCPLRARPSVSEVVEVDGTYEDYAGTDAVSLDYLPGVHPHEGLLRIRSSDGLTLVFNDLLHNILRHLPGVFAHLYGRLAIGTGRPGVHRMIGRTIVHDRPELAATLRTFAETAGLRRVIVAHGSPAILDDPRAFLLEIAERLAPGPR
ncbi:hypothetical protein [Paraliomyxa miuraensis]|uniref:hypothetical protein n=1 Tax=Paraliomyxa miuraensis TaxID=376150 RepID=UPI00224EFDA0|nr:hypothetical protein [Paraliomyxa miuraensis]MCX4244977.1 DUF4336 domain-containing protein [Paraliomyxa miuraensis]